MSTELRARLVAAYAELQQQFGDSSACRRIPLDFKARGRWRGWGGGRRDVR